MKRAGIIGLELVLWCLGFLEKLISESLSSFEFFDFEEIENSERIWTSGSIGIVVLIFSVEEKFLLTGVSMCCVLVDAVQPICDEVFLRL